MAGPGGGAVAGRPAGYGPWQSVYGLFRRWQLDGTWGLIIAALPVLADAAGHVSWDVSVDSGTAGRTSTPPAPARTAPRSRSRPAARAPPRRAITRWAGPAAA